jgi:photosystem II stability/assembly factor-like uncharacterized protein
MKTRITIFLVVFISVWTMSQSFTTDLLKGVEVRNIGPAGMSGRITAIDAVATDPDIIYAGSASGGLWKSESGGIAWKPIFDDQVTSSIGAVAIQQSNPDVIWVGTGEGNPRNSLNGGYGVFKSLDGGQSWQSMGLENTRHIHRILIDPSNPDIVYVGAIGTPWGTHPERGVFKTTDGGQSWEKVLYVNDSTGVADLIMDPSNPNKIIAAMWEHRRYPWFFNSGGPGSGLYLTVNGGKDWKKLTDQDGLPKGDLGRIGLAMATNKPNIVYALIESAKNALYKSEDGGYTWKMINDSDDIGNRPFYYSDIFVDPENENRIYSVFTYVNVSEDGGRSFTELMPAYNTTRGVHPDHHAFWIHPEDGSLLIDGNDGGLNISRDGGRSWRFAENLPVGQFYHVSVDNEYPYNVYGGMQDNGSWRGPGYVWKAQGIRNAYWQEIAFGDGFDVVPDLDDSQFGYAMSQQGYVSRYDWKTGNNYSVRPNHPDPEVQLRFNWNAAIGQDPFDNSTVYFGSQFVHKSTDKGLTWEVISPDLTTNDPGKQKQGESGGLTLDATGAENHCTILVIEPSSTEKDVLWIGSDDGQIHLTRDGGETWENLTANVKGLPAGSWITQIKASNKVNGEALLVANDYRRHNYGTYVFKTSNYGRTWKRIATDEAIGSFALCIVEDLVEPNLLFLGADNGLHISVDGGAHWEKIDSKLFPTVPVNDLIIHPREHDLVIGTFGRSFWVMDDIRPLRALAADPAILEQSAYLFEPPTGYLAAYQQANGTRFGGDAIYNGDNRRRGAMITYYVNPAEDAKDTLFLEIYKGDELIRTLRETNIKEQGLFRMYWGMDEKGPDRPSRRIRNSDREPSGKEVLPGEYRLVLKYAGEEHVGEIKVESDPRIQPNMVGLQSVYEAAGQIEHFTQLSADMVKALVERKDLANQYSQQLKEVNQEQFQTAIDSSKSIIKEIDGLVDLFLGKEDDRQGIVRSPKETIMSRIGKANSYVRSRPNGVTETEKMLMDQARTYLEEGMLQVNEFLMNKWKGYQTEMEAIEAKRTIKVPEFSLEKK